MILLKITCPNCKTDFWMADGCQLNHVKCFNCEPPKLFVVPDCQVIQDYYTGTVLRYSLSNGVKK